MTVRSAHPRLLERGFTLLEVLVAMAILGAGLGLAFTAVSSSQRLDELAGQHEQALSLGQAKLAEALDSPQNTLAQDTQGLRFGGVEYGYRIEVRPYEMANAERVKDAPLALEQLSVEVFWGPKDLPRTLRLVALRSRPAPPGAAP